MAAVIDPAPADILDAVPARVLPPDVVRLLLPGGEHHEVDIIEGITVRQLMEGALPQDLWPNIHVFHHGTRVQDWDGFTLRRGDRLVLAVVPQGGGGGGNKKGIIGAILTIAVAVIAPYAAPAIYTALGGTLVAANAGLYITAIQAGITLVGAMAISALVKPPSVSTAIADRGTAGAKAYSLTGQSNQPRPFGACLVVYGRHKVMPALASNPDVDNWGQNTTLTALYDFGLGWVQLEDFRIGDVDMWQYNPEVVLHTNELCRNLAWMTSRIGYDQYAITLQQNDPVVVTTKPDTAHANMDIQFPKGIFQTNAQGGILPFKVDLAAFWRKRGTSAWQQAPLDWFHGAMNRYYTSGAVATITYALYGTYDYNPTSSPAQLRALSAQYQWAMGEVNTQSEYALYVSSVPNPNYVFQYPNGPINEADYFNRYPDILPTGWNRGAAAHFESIGSREGRDPGVPVFIKATIGIPDFGWYAPTPSRVPTDLHRADQDVYGSDPHYYNQRVGGWYWISISGARPPAPVQTNIPFVWAMKPGYAFDESLYRARYPDVDRAINAGQVASGWQHFTLYGAFDGRDPYVALASTAVRMEVQAVGPTWLRIFFQFPEPETYELQLLRTDPSLDGTSGGTTQQINEGVLGILRSYQFGNVVLPNLRHTMMEMRVRATDQLQGVVQNLSAMATSVLRVAWHDTTTGALTFGYMATRNPIWIVLDILTGQCNPRPLRDDQIEWQSWMDTAYKCDTLRSWVINGVPITAPRYTCDIVIEDFSTVQELAESILSGCRSSLILTKAGTWGVLHDEAKTTPRQLITPANSWNFGGSRTFSQIPHALHVGFINRDNAWQRDEVTVYNDGYSAANATVFETLDTFGITDYAHAWAYGRYMLAQGIQRAELFTLTMDVENLLVQRGELVYVAHDVPRIGGMPARVVQVDPGRGGVQVDRILPAAFTGYAVRMNDGTTRTGAAYSDESYGASNWIALDDNTGVNADDLIVLGEFERTTQPYLVQRINPGADYSAELTLCKYVAGVYDADIGAIPPWEPGFGHDYLNGTDLKVTSVTAASRLYYVAREPRTDVLLQWLTSGWGLHHHEVTLILPSGQRVPIANDVGQLSYQWTLDALRDLRYYGIPLQFEIVPVSSVGFRGVPGYVSITINPDRTAPMEVPMFGANVQKETIDLYWHHPDEPDIGRYILRYTPNTETPNWTGAQQLAEVAYPGTKVNTGARTGSYGLRVEDTSGNQSAVVWRRTTVAVLPDINVVEVVNDIELTPPWPGKLDHVVVEGRELRSEGDFGAIYPEGIYYINAPVDLGDVYEVRVSSKIEAYGITADDYMHAWPTLSSVPALVRGTSGQWDAWLEVRGADEMLVMSDWLPSIHDIDPISTGTGSLWSVWRPVAVGDFTAQLLSFRIRMQSRDPDVRVVVRSGRIEIDMPDRVDAYGDIDVPAAGVDFVFPVAFRELESVAVTINGNPDPVVAVVTNKSAFGVTVHLRNTLTNAYVAGSIDLMAEGYGRLRPVTI